MRRNVLAEENSSPPEDPVESALWQVDQSIKAAENKGVDKNDQTADLLIAVKALLAALRAR